MTKSPILNQFENSKSIWEAVYHIYVQNIPHIFYQHVVLVAIQIYLSVM